MFVSKICLFKNGLSNFQTFNFTVFHIWNYSIIDCLHRFISDIKFVKRFDLVSCFLVEMEILIQCNGLARRMEILILIKFAGENMNCQIILKPNVQDGNSYTL